MRTSIFSISAIILTFLFSVFYTPKVFSEEGRVNTEIVDEGNQDEHANEVENEEEGHHSAPAWTVIPFVLLLLMIATGPLFYEHFWHKNYPKIAVILAVLVVSYYLFVIHNVHSPVHAGFEYIQFISLLASLYIASGGIVIKVNKKSTPIVNIVMLLIGSRSFQFDRNYRSFYVINQAFYSFK
ncbi:sodium:proton antiporter [Marivirga harenae]|uniref:sodium:proton antiporter n=1 Tax=Marivirga harenae TaxID=2010992 RepID=UPI0026DF7BF9|nr:sodium:proton antiporter [Marivirga harenae]WKV13583.1 sodium:proton antiporter [Marivirga harenae]